VGVEGVWPYVLPFPLDEESRRAIWGVLTSRVGLSILRSLPIKGRVYQRDLIAALPYSNKSIITLLKRMVSAGLLREGFDWVGVRRGRRVRVRWYEPTPLGRWLALFLRPPTEVPRDVATAALRELFQLYMFSVAEACRRLGVGLGDLGSSLSEVLIREVIRSSPRVSPRVVVCGCVALDVYGRLEEFPRFGECVYVEEIGVCQGGMGANVAVALSRLGVPTAFMGRVGCDPAAAIALRSLCENGVDVSAVVASEAETPRTIILIDGEGRRKLFSIASPDAALSPTSIEEVNLEALKTCQMVYLGEFFVEVASKVAEVAEEAGKTVVYRPGNPYLKLGVDRLSSVLRHVDMFILNHIGWGSLQESSARRLKSPRDLLRYGVEVVVLTLGEGGCRVYKDGHTMEFPVPRRIKERFRVVDTTGAGDSFTSGLIKGMLDGWSLEDAVTLGQLASAITCSRMGSSTSLPTLDEVMRAGEELGISFPKGA